MRRLRRYANIPINDEDEKETDAEAAEEERSAQRLVPGAMPTEAAEMVRAPNAEVSAVVMACVLLPTSL